MYECFRISGLDRTSGADHPCSTLSLRHQATEDISSGAEPARLLACCPLAATSVPPGEQSPDSDGGGGGFAQRAP
jgi:hypothetical protein